MSTVLVTPYQVLSKRIRWNYWPICTAMILLGMILMISSYRETVLTCQRQQDLCTLTRLGWLAGPTHSFSPNDIISLSKDACCNSDDATYQLLLRTRQGSFALNQTRVSRENSLKPAGGLINQFITDSTVQQLDVHLLDLRFENLSLGIFFLVMGLFYLVAMAETQLLVQDALTGNRSFQSQAQLDRLVKGALLVKQSGGQAISTEKEGRRMGGWRIWLCWESLSLVGPLLGIGLVRFVLRSNIQPSFWALSLLLIYLAIIIMVIGAQAWVIQRAIGEGRLWLVCTSIGLIFLAVLIILAVREQSLQNDIFFILFPIYVLTPGVFQWWVLRRRLPRASWWIIASALGQSIFFSASDNAIKLMSISGLYQSQPTGVTSAIYDLSRWLGWFAYLAITGAMLVYLLYVKDKQSQARQTG